MRKPHRQVKMDFRIVTVLFLLMFSTANGNGTVKPQPTPGTQEACYCLERAATHLYAPVGATFFLDGGVEKFVVVEQRGTVKEFNYGKSTMFMDIRNQVVASSDFGESRGLLSMILSPDFSTSGKVYAYYIRNVDSNDYAYVSEFKTKGGMVDLSSERFLLRVYQPFKHGNGGPMLFGDDGYLYITTGDGGAEDDITGNAQNKNSFHGSVLRIDVSSGRQSFTRGQSGVAKQYAVPDDNPFINDTSAREELYAYGFRNMWGCSVDAKAMGGTGKIYCAETGTSKFDEIDVIESGKNYGWNIKEGTACFNASSCGTPIENEGLPIHEFKHNASHALVGGYIYRGATFPWMNGTFYTFGDTVTGKTYTLEEVTPANWTRHDWQLCDISRCPKSAQARPLNYLLAFAQDLKGELYLLMTKTLVISDGGGTMFKTRAPVAGSSNRLLMSPCVLAVSAVVTWAMSSQWTRS